MYQIVHFQNKKVIPINMNKCKKRIVITKDDEEKLDKIRQYYINSIIHCLQYKELLSILAVYAVDLRDLRGECLSTVLQLRTCRLVWLRWWRSRVVCSQCCRMSAPTKAVVEMAISEKLSEL